MMGLVSLAVFMVLWISPSPLFVLKWIWRESVPTFMSDCNVPVCIPDYSRTRFVFVFMHSFYRLVRMRIDMVQVLWEEAMIRNALRSDQVCVSLSLSLSVCLSVWFSPYIYVWMNEWISSFLFWPLLLFTIKMLLFCSFSPFLSPVVFVFLEQLPVPLLCKFEKWPWLIVWVQM